MRLPIFIVFYFTLATVILARQIRQSQNEHISRNRLTVWSMQPAVIRVRLSVWVCVWMRVSEWASVAVRGLGGAKRAWLNRVECVAKKTEASKWGVQRKQRSAVKRNSHQEANVWCQQRDNQFKAFFVFRQQSLMTVDHHGVIQSVKVANLLDFSLSDKNSIPNKIKCLIAYKKKKSSIIKVLNWLHKLSATDNRSFCVCSWLWQFNWHTSHTLSSFIFGSFHTWSDNNDCILCITSIIFKVVWSLLVFVLK